MLGVRWLVAVVCLGSQDGGAPASTAPGRGVHHETHEGGSHEGASSLQRIQRELDRAEASLGERTAPRLVSWDAALPGSQAEYDDVARGLLVLAVATAESADDLPLQRVYVVGPHDKKMGLILVGTMPPAALRQLRTSGKAGRNVWAGVFYLPVARQVAKGPLFADFPLRKDFQLGAVPIEALGDLRDSGGKLNLYLGNVAQMALREYPWVELEPDFRKALGPAAPAGAAGP